MDDTAFTVVYISPKMFEMIAKLGESEMDKEVKEVIKDLKGLRILVSERNGMKYYNEATKTLDLKSYDELMTVRDGDENVRFVVKEDGAGTISELLLLVGSVDEFVMMSFVGKINLEKISKLSKSADIEGLEHLEKVKKQ